VPSQINLTVRASTVSPFALTRSVSSALTVIHPSLALTFIPLAEQVRASLTQERVLAALSGIFGALSLILAALGIYGVTAYAASLQRTEIGIRMALGAQPGQIVRLVSARIAVLVSLGLAIGIGLSLWASRFVSSLLYGVQPRDAQTLGTAVLVLAAVGGLSGWFPAWRASRLDPTEVLRES
jgi:ABC-type antimicrobial peptide transport system permease subunit